MNTDDLKLIFRASWMLRVDDEFGHILPGQYVILSSGNKSACLRPISLTYEMPGDDIMLSFESLAEYFPTTHVHFYALQVVEQDTDSKDRSLSYSGVISPKAYNPQL